MTPSITEDFISYNPFPADPCETIVVKRYRSSKTGLAAIHADIDGPLVSGFLTLATKVLNDDGCPHTLEHLVFLGSEKYPYKGALDLLAPRAYAPGTNAWTDLDHTCYTITTAGSDGFLQLLPVYVDHILYPTLTDEGFYTEVHHINQNGEDAGVVYCEMQARENTMTDIMQRRLQHLVYPKDSGYQNEAGGLMECLRELKIESIREYHNQYYRPDNLVIVITGKLDQVHLMSTLEQIDKAILDRSLPFTPAVPSKRTWVPSPFIPDLEKNTIETICFPGEAETLGEIAVTWLGPQWNEFLEIQALHMLNSYLTDTPIAPLRKMFAERSDPFCTELDFRMAERSRVAMTVTFQNVPVHKADDVPALLISTLQNIVNNEDIDMERMKGLIQKEKLKYLDDYETRATYMLALPAITASIYGDLGSEDFVNALQQAKYLDTLINYSKKDWIQTLKKAYIDTAYTAIIGKPSMDMSKELLEDERIRVEAQHSALGENGLKLLAEKLEHATRINESQIPSRIMDGFPIPSVSSISSIDVQTAINPYHKISELPNNTVQSYISNDGHAKDVPYFIQFDHIQSAFVSISVYLDTASLPSHLRPYGRMYMDTIFASPIRIDANNYFDHNEAIQKLDLNLISYDATLGYQGAFREYIVINIKVEANKYEDGIKWLNLLMWNIEFTQDRLIIAVNKTLNDVPQAKRSGKLVTDWTIRAIHTDITKSTEATCSYLYQDTFLPPVLRKLSANPNSVIKDINEFRSILCRGENMRVQVMGNILNLKNPKSTFKCWNQHHNLSKYPPPIIRSKNVFGLHGRDPGHCTTIVELPSTESSFSVHSAKGPSDFDSPEIPGLLILMEMLHAMEGVYTRLIRGLGLAYKCWLTNITEASLISLCIMRSSDILSAFEHVRNVTHQLANGEMIFDTYALEGAKSSVIFDIADCEGTRDVAATQSFLNKILRQSKRQKVDFLKAIQDVTIEDITKLLNRYIVPLFDSKTSNHVITTSCTKAQDIARSFSEMGHPSQIIKMEDVYAKNIFQQVE